MVARRGFNAPLLTSRSRWRRQSCISQSANGSAMKSARHGHFHFEGKKKPTTELKTFLCKKFFRGEKIRKSNFVRDFIARHVHWINDFCNTFWQSLTNFGHEKSFIVNSRNEHILSKNLQMANVFMTCIFVIWRFLLVFWMSSAKKRIFHC